MHVHQYWPDCPSVIEPSVTGATALRGKNGCTCVLLCYTLNASGVFPGMYCARRPRRLQKRVALYAQTEADLQGYLNNVPCCWGSVRSACVDRTVQSTFQDPQLIHQPCTQTDKQACFMALTCPPLPFLPSCCAPPPRSSRQDALLPPHPSSTPVTRHHHTT